VVVTENFNAYNNALPLGWQWTGISGQSETYNRWQDRNNAIPLLPNPNIAGNSPPNYLFYKATGAVPGDQAVLTSKSFDLSARGLNTANISFWMYRDNQSPNNDSLTIYAGNSPSFASAVRLGVLSRNNSFAPAAPANTWNAYAMALPVSINTSHVYIFFVGTSRNGRDILIDDFTIETWPSPMTFSSTTMWYQGIQVVQKPSANEPVIGIRIITSNGGLPLNLYRLSFNSNGSTNPVNDIASAKLWYTGQSPVFNMLLPVTNQTGSTFSPITAGNKITFMNPGATPAPLLALTSDTNYFWLSYDVTAAATVLNLLDAEFDSVVVGPSWVGATYYAPSVSSMPGSLTLNPYCTPTFFSPCNSCFVQGAYLAGENGSKISTGSSAYALPTNTGAMSNGVLYCTNPCIVSPTTTYRYKIYPPVVNHTATLFFGNTYNLKLQFGIVVFNGIGAWIDYNNDYDFNDTLVSGGISYYEKIGQVGATGIITNGCSGGGCSVTGINGNSTVINISFKVPPFGTPGLASGNLRLRLLDGLGAGIVSPCSPNAYGEAEDYTITVTENCSITGVCQWLGYTNDWNTPSNWCPAIPTLNDIASIDRSKSNTPAAAYHYPVISSGVDASCRVLRISDTDTVFIYSSRYNESTGTGLVNPATLTVADSMSIGYNTPAGNGALKVLSAISDSAQLNNGGFIFPTITPFQSNRRNMRMQLIISKAELNANGMIEGDIIDSLVFYLRTLSSAASDQFDNFTIKMAHLTVPGWGFSSPPVAWAPTGAFTTVFGPSTLDVRNVQATHPNAVPAVTAANRGQLSLVLLSNSFSWNGVDDVVLDICFRNLTNPLPANLVQLSQSQTTGRRTSCWANNSSGIASSVLCGTAFPLPGGLGNIATAADYRPNVTLKYRRMLNRAVITMAGDSGAAGGFWINNGNFTGGSSRVIFTGNAGQEIAGSNPTTFSELEIDQHNGNVLMKKDIAVDSALYMTSGELTLNRNLLTINKSGSASVSRTAGWIRSEDQPPGNYGRMAWNLGATAGMYEYPFGLNAAGYIPFRYSPTGTAGVVTVATYRTGTNNTPYAVAQPPFGTGVNHMQSQATGLDVSVSDVVDRFWQIHKSGPSGTATLRLSYIPTVAPAGEEPAPGGYVYTAQRFQTPGGTGSPAGGWANLGGANGPGYVNVVLANDIINGPWTLGNASNPLPVELLDFNAVLIDKKVKAYWTTVSEINNDHFVLERKSGEQEFDFITMVKSKGAGVARQDYEAWDFFPREGLQYYRLKTYDLNGNEAISAVVPIEINTQSLFSINHVYTEFPLDRATVSISCNSILPYRLTVTDVFGRILFSQDNPAAGPGEHFIELNSILHSHGIYFILLESSKEVKVKQFMF